MWGWNDSAPPDLHVRIGRTCDAASISNDGCRKMFATTCSHAPQVSPTPQAWPCFGGRVPPNRPKLRPCNRDGTCDRSAAFRPECLSTRRRRRTCKTDRAKAPVPAKEPSRTRRAPLRRERRSDGKGGFWPCRAKRPTPGVNSISMRANSPFLPRRMSTLVIVPKRWKKYGLFCVLVVILRRPLSVFLTGWPSGRLALRRDGLMAGLFCLSGPVCPSG